MHSFNQFVLNSITRVALPIAVYPGAALTGATVHKVVTDPQAQFAASVALHERYRTPVVLSAMDLSVEAEAFGCEIHTSEHEIPTAVGAVVSKLEQAQSLRVPQPGDKRTGVYLETVARLRQLPARPLVLAGCIGPFSLAGRLVGLSEACGLTLTDPELIHLVLEKSTEFLTAYARAFKVAGADGIIMAEPAAGLLSPRGLAEFSAAYVKRIVQGVADENFTLILHNCAARLVHLPAVLESGTKTFHFGAPMDIVAALGKVPPDVVLCGNLDPTAVFHQGTPETVANRTSELLKATRTHRNFVISSGCDVPPASPLANLDAFYAAVTTV